ncbi:MAG: hypothetical protein ACREK8_01015 [Gemmatimonadales bacterium]
MMWRCCGTMLIFLSACSHSDSYPVGGYDVGPSSSGSDVILTFNTDQNYWPTLTADSSAVVYEFIDVNLGAGGTRHRCMGALPVAGGTRFWQWCDTRASETDSATGFDGFAMGTDGRLLYAETVTPRVFPFQTPSTVLWLADSATPFRRRSLVTLPIVVGDSTVSWLADLEWTGPNSFIGLGQGMILLPHCNLCVEVDSVFNGKVVVAGTITMAGATLTAIPGTAGATGYSLADGGASIVFTQLDNANLMKVPAAGGAPLVAAVATPRAGIQLLGVSCRGTTCVVALGPALLGNPASHEPPGSGPYELRSVSLVTGTATTVLTSSATVASPVLLPSGDVIAQVGPGLGHLQTFNSPDLTLHLYHGLVH